MRKILFILTLIPCFVFGQSPKKDHFGVYNFRDTVYFQRVPYNSGAGIVALGLDTVTGSPTFGKLVRKTASSGTSLTQYYVGVGDASNLLTGTNKLQFQSGALSVGNSSTDDGIISFGYTTNKEVVSVSTPSSGYGHLYAKNDGTVHYINSSAVDYNLTQSKSNSKGFFLEAPTSSEAVDMWQTPVDITVTSLKAILRGSSPSVTYNIKFGSNITSATSVFTSDITCTSVTTGCSNSSGFNDATIPAGSFIWIVTTAASGTISSIGFTLNYTED